MTEEIPDRARKQLEEAGFEKKQDEQLWIKDGGGDMMEPIKRYIDFREEHTSEQEPVTTYSYKGRKTTDNTKEQKRLVTAIKSILDENQKTLSDTEEEK